MGKPFVFATLIVFAFCFSSVLGLTQPDEHFFVESKVYCDPCHVEFETNHSYPLSGVKVSLECRSPENNSLTYISKGHTDKNGMYSLVVKGDHADEICKLETVKSTNHECNEVMTNRGDRIVLTKNMGVSSLARFVNPLGFKTQAIDPGCASIINTTTFSNIFCFSNI